MSTAGRPTYNARVGSQVYSGIRTGMVSARNQNAHTKLKYRQVGQATQEELTSRDFKSELEIKEKKHISVGKTDSLLSLRDKSTSIIENSVNKSSSSTPLLLIYDIPEISSAQEFVTKKYDDADAGDANSDADLLSSSEEEDDDEEDDELELQAELERIKAERLNAQLKKEAEERELEEQANRNSSMKGNPLINLGSESSSKVKRQWNDDVVFRNQTKDEPDVKKRFINDTVRNDFHRTFLKKYMK